MNQYYRVNADGILRTASETLRGALHHAAESDEVCTLLGPLTPEEFISVHRVLWPDAVSWKSHYFVPSENDQMFCAKCGLYLTHRLHVRDLALDERTMTCNQK